MNSGSVPPKGATYFAAGFELAMIVTNPRSAASLRERRQTSDVVAATDRHGGDAGRVGPRHRGLDRAAHDPLSWKPGTVPDLRGARVLHNLELAGHAHRALADLLEIQRRHREAVRAAPHHVGEDEHAPYRVRLVFVHPGRAEQRESKHVERIDRDLAGRIGHGSGALCGHRSGHHAAGRKADSSAIRQIGNTT